MKPTKMRNRQIYRAGKTVRSRQLAGTLSDDLRERYGRRSVRIVEGDTVRVLRGEYKNVDGRVSKVSTDSGRIAIEGIKKEKGKGDKFDVMIHASNVMVTSLNTGDGWRISKLEGKSKKEAKKSTPKDDKEELKKDAKSEVIPEETDADLDEKTDPKDDTDKADAEEVRTVEASDDKESDKPSKEDT